MQLSEHSPCRYLATNSIHSVLSIEKKFSAKALSYGLPRLDIDGVMPYDCVRLKYAWDVY